MARPGYKQVGRWSPDGVIVTLARRDDGRTQTVHVSDNHRTAALRACLRPFDPLEWRVQTISTPQSIYDDLVFARELRRPHDAGSPRHGGTTHGPEPALLGRAGLTAFL